METQPTFEVRNLDEKEIPAITRLLKAAGIKAGAKVLRDKIANFYAWICLGVFWNGQIVGILTVKFEDEGRLKRVDCLLVNLPDQKPKVQEEVYYLLFQDLKSRLDKGDHIEISVRSNSLFLCRLLPENGFIKMKDLHTNDGLYTLFRFGRGTKSSTWEGDCKGVHEPAEIEALIRCKPQ